MLGSIDTVMSELEQMSIQIKGVIGTIDANKLFAMDLSQNMGAQMHQIVESQNRILGDYTKKFFDFENKIAVQIQDKFLKLMPLIEELNHKKPNINIDYSERILQLEK